MCPFTSFLFSSFSFSFLLLSHSSPPICNFLLHLEFSSYFAAVGCLNPTQQSTNNTTDPQALHILSFLLSFVVRTSCYFEASSSSSIAFKMKNTKITILLIAALTIAVLCCAVAAERQKLQGVIRPGIVAEKPNELMESFLLLLLYSRTTLYLFYGIGTIYLPTVSLLLVRFTIYFETFQSTNHPTGYSRNLLDSARYYYYLYYFLYHSLSSS